MRRKRTMQILLIAALCTALYTIVISRLDTKTNIIFGGVDGAFVSSDSVTFKDPNAIEAPEPTEDIWPEVDLTMPQYQIANNDHVLSSAFQPEVSKISRTNYMMFSTAAMPYLDALLDAIEDAGFSFYIGGAYRSYSYQSQLFNRKASQIAYGMGLTGPKSYLDPKYQDAVEQAKLITMMPGTSEHQLGLSVDLFDRNYSRLVYSEMNQDFYEWLDSHCAEYGFIKRYPTKKLLLTGWDEPWHYRYVGKEAATFIMENDLCYEEFYAHYDENFKY